MKIKEFLKQVWMTEEDVLFQVSYDRNRSIDFCRELRTQLQDDRNLLMNIKKDKEALWDSTLFNVHTALLARAFNAKPSIQFKQTKEWVEREITMLNSALDEDLNASDIKTLKYYKDWNKFWAWFSAVARTGWDGIYKKNKFEVINPLNVVFDPMGDYFSGNYSFVWVDRIVNKQGLKDYENSKEMTPWETMEDWAMRYKREAQQEKDMNPDRNMDEYETYLHFGYFNDIPWFVEVANNWTLVIKAGLIPAWDYLQEKNKEVRKFPIVFYFWKPLPDIPCGDRPANYVRDVQVMKSKVANLRMKKAQAELYPMRVYNKDFINGNDLNFWLNKTIGFSSGIEWANVKPSNLVANISPETRLDATREIMQDADKQVERSTSIGEIIQGTNTQWRETLGTNQLIQNNTDINLALNEEIDLIGEEQFVMQWFYGYYENFTDADKKLVFAGIGTTQQPLQITRKEFIINGNLSIKLTSTAETERQKQRKKVNFSQFYAFLQWLPWVPSISLVTALREFWENSEIEPRILEKLIGKTPQESLQLNENEVLKRWEWVDINPTDDNYTHMITCDRTTPEWEGHWQAHMIQYTQQTQQVPEAQQGWQMVNQAMAQIGNEQTSLSTNPQ